MSELQVVEHVDVVVPLGVQDAERLDKRIRLMANTTRENFEKVGRLLDEAKQGNLHEVLGFKSWTAYVADAVGGQLQLSGDARQAMVQMLAGEGMSVRAIADTVGVSKSTVDRDLAQVVHDGTTDADSDADSTVPQRDSSVGLDGKTRRKPKRKPRPEEEPEPVAPEPESVKERRPQLRIVFRENVDEMVRLYQETHNLHSDPRWKTTTFSEKDTRKLLLLLEGIGQLHRIATKQADAGETPEELTA